MTCFIEEISGFVLAQFGVIEMDRLGASCGQLHLIRGKGFIEQMASMMYDDI
jgi:hypothetical protein